MSKKVDLLGAQGRLPLPGGRDLEVLPLLRGALHVLPP